MATMLSLRKKKDPAQVPAMMSGDEQTGGYVSCPSCGRPVADGIVRCAGCGMRILMGVAASRALLFLTTGAVLGLLVGGLSVGWIMGLSRPAAATAVTAAQSTPS